MPYKGDDSKDQLRSLKSAVQSRLSTFRPRRNTLLGEDMSISPSPTDSECSTLINFTSDDVGAKGISRVIYEDEPTRAVMLDEENCSWMDERVYSAAFKSNCQPRSDHCHVYSGATDMIDEDDQAWCMPAAKPSKTKTSTLFSLSPRRQKAPSRTGLQPEMLDPEDRAWM